MACLSRKKEKEKQTCSKPSSAAFAVCCREELEAETDVPVESINIF
jgi:hypothetical protein